MKTIMKAVLKPEGTGKNAFIRGISIGGKTGTAQKFNRKEGKYFEKRYISSFIGAFPLENPQYIILVKIDDPIKNKYASISAAPAFRNIALYLTGRMKRKDDISPVKYHPGSTGKNEIISYLKPDKIDPLEELKKNGARLFKLPDLKNMSLRQAMKTLKKINPDFIVSGSGSVFSQWPEAGKYVLKNSKIRIILR